MGFVLSFPFRENLQTALTEGLPVVQVYWGEFDRNLVDLVHSFGAKVIHQVKSHSPMSYCARHVWSRIAPDDSHFISRLTYSFSAFRLHYFCNATAVPSDGTK